MSEKPAIYIPGKTGEVSDGYHTFDELYEHRCTLYVALVQHVPNRAWRSYLHDDGKGFDGWFVCGIDLPAGPVTYHLPERMWSFLDGIKTLDRAPKFDGHTSADVIERLTAWIQGGPKA